MVYYGWDKAKGWFYPTKERALLFRPDGGKTLYEVTVKDGKIEKWKEVRV